MRFDDNYAVNLLFIIVFSIVSVYNESAFRIVVVILLGLILIEIRSIISLLIDIARAFVELDRGGEGFND